MTAPIDPPLAAYTAQVAFASTVPMMIALEQLCKFSSSTPTNVKISRLFSIPAATQEKRNKNFEGRRFQGKSKASNNRIRAAHQIFQPRDKR